ERQPLGQPRLAFPRRDLSLQPVLDLDPGALRLELDYLLEVAHMSLDESGLQAEAALLTEQVHVPGMPAGAQVETRSNATFTDLLPLAHRAPSPGIGCARG